MKVNIIQKLVIFSIIVLIGNGLVGYAIYESNQKRIDAEKWVQHTQQVIYESGNVLSLAIDIESSSRGYVITKDSSFLIPLIISEKKIFTSIEHLSQLAQDNPEQQKRVDSLKYYIKQRLYYSHQAIELRTNQGIVAAIKLVLTKQGKHFSDRMREITASIQHKENQLLLQRKQTNERTLNNVNTFSIILFVLMTAITILLLIVTGKNLLQNKEKEKRAAELIIANNELAFQNDEKGKRAAELIIANEELHFQNEEKEKRAAELILTYQKLVFQNEEKEKIAAELVIADKELEFQNEEKGKRAAELVIANQEVVFQSEEKEKQEAANKELEAFSYSVSHDLRAPLRHIGGFVDLLLKNNAKQLDESGIRYLNIVSESSHEMGNLIDALLTFSRLSRTELQRTKINFNDMITRVLKTFADELINRNIEIIVSELPEVKGDKDLLNQVWINLISNAVKYTRNVDNAVIEIGNYADNTNQIFYIKDNGAGFDMKYADKLFGVFQRLHKAKDFEGIGIGLANVNRIIVRHGGTCWAKSEEGLGATFFFSLPIK